MSDFKDQKQELQGLRSQIQKAIFEVGDQVQWDLLPDEERDDPKAQEGQRRDGQKAQEGEDELAELEAKVYTLL